MIRTFLIAGLGGMLMTACYLDETGSASYAVDTDGDGIINCEDVEHAHWCMHYEAGEVCGNADVNHDGTVDDTDLHGLHAGITEMGHNCDQEPHHGTCGQQCNMYQHRWQWRHCQCADGEGEAEECTGEPVCDGEQYQWQWRWRWRHCGEGCEGDDCCCDDDPVDPDDGDDEPEPEPEPDDDGPIIL